MYKSYLLALSFTFLLVSCKKEGDGVAPQPVTPPIITPVTCTLERTNADNGIYTVYEYDAAKRIKAVKRHLPLYSNSPARDFTFTFYRDSNNRIVEITGGDDSTPQIQQKQTYEYDDQGRWTKNTVTNVPADSYSTVVVPEYDAQGLIIKATETRKSGSTTYVKERTYEYRDGNVIRTQTKDQDLIRTCQYEYYLDQENKLSEYERQTYYTFGIGSPPKNMIKSYRITTNSPNHGIEEGFYTYEFTAQGYVHQQTFKSTASGSTLGNSTFTNIYKCN
jgi:hypothetical protein